MRLLILSCEFLNDDQIGYLLTIFNRHQIKVIGAVVYKENEIVVTSIYGKLINKIKRIRYIIKSMQKIGLSKIMKRINKRLYYRIESKFHKSVKMLAGVYFNEKDVDTLFTSNKYSNEVMKFIKTKQPDTIFAMDFGFIKEPLLSIVPNGIISYHHGDFRKYRGIPACFWPMYYAETGMNVTVQILDKGIDCGAIVKEKVIPIFRKDTLKVLNRRAYTQTYSMAADACELLDNEQFTPQKLLKKELGKVYTTPTIVQWMIFISRVTIRRFRWFLLKT